MQDDKARPATQSGSGSGGKFIDTLIAQWMNRTGSNISLQQTEEVAESSRTQVDKQQVMQSQERMIQNLKRKLREYQQREESLSTSLETEVRNKEEFQTKLNATWEYIDNITEYFNYIQESLASFEQHRVNLSNMYDNVILKQQEAIQKLQLNDTKSKEMENYVTELKNKSLLQEKRLQEAMAKQNKLQKQLENSENELQLQRNELMSTNAEEKLTIVKEQQRMLLECENLQSRLQTVEKEKSDIAKSAAQLENKLLLQEEKIQEALAEQNKFKIQAETAKRELYSQKNEMANEHAEEKKMLVEELRQLQLKSETLQSRLNALEQDNSDIMETVVKKDALISKFQNEILICKNQIDTITAKYNETRNKNETLTEKQNMQEKELLAKTERIHSLETTLSIKKQKEASLVSDVNRIEKNLTSEMDYSKNLESKLSDVQKDLQLAQKRNAEMQITVEKTKSTYESANNELQQQLQALQKEKEEIIKRESTRIKNADIVYDNVRVKHIQEMSALKDNYEKQLVEMKKTIENLNKTISGSKKENGALNKSLTEMRTENVRLKNDYDFIIERNKNLQGKLKEATEMTQMKSMDDRKLRKEPRKTSQNISTSVDLYNSDEEKPSSQTPEDSFASSMKSLSQKEQEAEVTSVGKKFFKRPLLPRTYRR
ncbi:putative leucine-rich repeat-containing protein DDB_G0290503 [Solenopsis invicta]|uniref:putative leucine-rich repeat-containing protein DDB_G0290503 n=1 Tax=Solenopsis invicta TaxID=13686 RepID=UPI000595B597|nr:putative leucine-rich repeat-containing protein DDB_G0290503 [Solenopsis invicta]